jgi:myo-inositol-1(or 4)-monophosphatase
MYVAARGEDGHDAAWVMTRDRIRSPLRVHPTFSLSGALVTNYLMRPLERFVPLAQQDGLMTALDAPSEDGKSRGRIGVDFGSVSLCHVAAGFTDATIEFAKGFAAWDLYPGHYILRAAGGVVIDLSGENLPLNYHLESPKDVLEAMNRRQKFIAASTAELAEKILGALHL